MIPQNSLTDIAYSFIKEKIVSLHYKAGDQIAEEAVANELNISRTPVRNALKALEEEEFVKLIPNKGAVVSHISINDVKEICELRLLLERWALARSIYSIPDEELDNAERLFIEDFNNLSWESHRDADRNMHGLLTKYSNSKRITKMLDTLITQLNWYRNGASEVTDAFASKQEHMTIIDAIRKRNLQLADEALTYHLNQVEERFINAYKG